MNPKGKITDKTKKILKEYLKKLHDVKPSNKGARKDSQSTQAS
jgi:hypothetical protein